MPQLDAASLDLWQRMVLSVPLYAEFGSGGSTLLADRLGVRGRSVESDRVFAHAVRRRLGGDSGMDVRWAAVGLTWR